MITANRRASAIFNAPVTYFAVGKLSHLKAMDMRMEKIATYRENIAMA